MCFTRIRSSDFRQTGNILLKPRKHHGLSRDLNPGPLAPKARIIPLDHWAMLHSRLVSDIDSIFYVSNSCCGYSIRGLLKTPLSVVENFARKIFFLKKKNLPKMIVACLWVSKHEKLQLWKICVYFGHLVSITVPKIDYTKEKKSAKYMDLCDIKMSPKVSNLFFKIK